jgi:hypothetical protein
MTPSNLNGDERTRRALPRSLQHIWAVIMRLVIVTLPHLPGGLPLETGRF